jgi:hypothetical protein
MAGDPKKLYKQLRNEPGTSPHDLEVLGPSQTKSPTYNSTFLTTPPPQVSNANPIARSISSDDESPLVKTIPRKTLIFLISTLNATFQPDYEFSSCTSQDFSRETNFEVGTTFFEKHVGHSNTTLLRLVGQNGSRFTVPVGYWGCLPVPLASTLVYH